MTFALHWRPNFMFTYLGLTLCDCENIAELTVCSSSVDTWQCPASLARPWQPPH